MTERQKKLKKLLYILVPVFLLTMAYGYNEIRAVQTRKAERRKKAQEQSRLTAEADQNAPIQEPAAGPGTGALPSPPPGATPADNHANVPPAAPTSFAGVSVTADAEAQDRRAALPWGRDPFVPPDTRGPAITTPGDLESPRGKKHVVLNVGVSDGATGGSGIASAVLHYTDGSHSGLRTVPGRPPKGENGDGSWVFTLPAPEDGPLTCYVVAVDRGKLKNSSRSGDFRIIPPPKHTAVTPTVGAAVTLTLRGISWSGKTGVALINEDVLARGEYIQGYEVVKIVKNGVLLKRNNQEIFLQLKE